MINQKEKTKKIKDLEQQITEIKNESIYENTLKGQIEYAEQETFKRIKEAVSLLSGQTGKHYNVKCGETNISELKINKCQQRSAVKQLLEYCLETGDWKNKNEMKKWVSDQISLF